jgi:hypothetical protein
MRSPDNPLILLGYLATKPSRGKAEISIFFNYFNLLGRFCVFASPSTFVVSAGQGKTNGTRIKSDAHGSSRI